MARRPRLRSTEASKRKRPFKEDERGAWVELSVGVVYCPHSHPHLELIEATGKWRIRKGDTTIVLGRITEEAAKRLYVEWEVDPDAFHERRKRQRIQARRTVERAIVDYLNDCGRRKLARETMTKKLHVLRELGRRFGTKRLKFVTTANLREVIEDSWPDVNNNTLRLYISVLQSFCTFCVDRGWMSADVPKGIKPPPSEPTGAERSRILTPIQVKRVLEQLDAERWRPCALVQWALGLRYGELTRIKGQDVRGVGTANQRLYVRPGKTKRGREIPIMDSSVVDACLALATLHLPRQVANYWQALERACRKAGVPRISSHALRHMCATRWAEEGIDIRDHMRWMGHSSYAMSERYIAASKKPVKLPARSSVADVLDIAPI